MVNKDLVFTLLSRNQPLKIKDYSFSSMFNSEEIESSILRKDMDIYPSVTYSLNKDSLFNSLYSHLYLI